ncbi:hypothetical protein N7491_009589 [Penicillium cf. griseofulvum]|uniref:Uncharacterized protein n=1 Tax=Penicillium cf. griseofulvum TaxID=2972120 RepID=A0A9W9MF62_9EURO|nr:hypothetical protein N7472_004818 [Penicillium cf. griseofulvum]KAJ5424373.1 hypothetical protein N7491_009589 [Penicillium cf. griseofulvum]KAJ5442386.1 hypothetical protein N7445_005393 [Penicillium cf. griseofulvum]
MNLKSHIESGKEAPGKKMSAQKKTGSTISQAQDDLIKARCAACITLPPYVGYLNALYNLTLAPRFSVTSWYLYLVRDLTQQSQHGPSYNLTSLIPFTQQYHLGIVNPTDS